MIRVTKGDPPKGFSNRAGIALGNLRRQYLSDVQSYASGESTLKANSKVYGSTAVKDSLKHYHNRKCAYCEEFLPPKIAHGHVEHFRPTAFSEQERGGTKHRPGYFWIAYDWDNFLLSCHYCNSVQKGNLFPLSNPNSRVRVEGTTAHELPTLIKPDAEDPAPHFDWRRDLPIGVTGRGKATIQILGLDSPAHEERLKRYNEAVELRRIVVELHASVDANARDLALRTRTKLEHWSHPTEPFSAMIAAFLRKNPLP